MLKSSFDDAYAFIRQSHIEGEFSDDPDDPGGPTKWGLSQRFLNSIGWGDVRTITPPTDFPL